MTTYICFIVLCFMAFAEHVCSYACAFLNSEGGQWLMVVMDDDGLMQGIKVSTTSIYGTDTGREQIVSSKDVQPSCPDGKLYSAVPARGEGTWR